MKELDQQQCNHTLSWDCFWLGVWLFLHRYSEVNFQSKVHWLVLIIICIGNLWNIYTWTPSEHDGLSSKSFSSSFQDGDTFIWFMYSTHLGTGRTPSSERIVNRSVLSLESKLIIGPAVVDQPLAHNKRRLYRAARLTMFPLHGQFSHWHRLPRRRPILPVTQPARLPALPTDISFKSEIIPLEDGVVVVIIRGGW